MILGSVGEEKPAVTSSCETLVQSPCRGIGGGYSEATSTRGEQIAADAPGNCLQLGHVILPIGVCLVLTQTPHVAGASVWP